MPPHSLYVVRSPVSGVFYRRPDPDSAPFVSEGDVVEDGGVVGIVEVMKQFYDVQSEVRGRVVRATPAGADRFTGLDWWLGRRGAPLLADAVTTLECEIVAEHPAGDHWIVIGRVDDLRTSPHQRPALRVCGRRSRTQPHGLGADVYAGTVAEDVGPSEMRRQSAVRDT